MFQKKITVIPDAKVENLYLSKIYISKYVMFVVSNMYLHIVGLKGKKQILIFKTIENEIFQ